MSTDSTQVMRVLDRCLDTAGSGSGTVPGVAAAAAKARTDPEMHNAISLILAAGNVTTRSRECWRLALAAVREAGSGEYPCSLAERCDGNDGTTPIRRMLRSCQTASQAAGEPDRRTAAALAELFLAAIMLEMSSLGTDRSRQLRNLVAHSDIAAARNLWRNMADQQDPGSTRSSSRTQDTPGATCRAANKTRTAETSAGPIHPARAGLTPGSAEPPASLRLSPRQREILRLADAGKSPRQIAEALCISPTSAAVQLRRIRAKLAEQDSAVIAAAIQHQAED
jgi:DNA-binding CsgD family transcriptional regulator